MKPCQYVRPSALTDALALLDRHGPDARVLAGGTDLLVQMRERGVSPAVVVDIKGLDELAPRIDVAGGRLRIGAQATMTQIVRDPSVRHYFPALAEAARVVGSLQIRSRATVAGNLANASPAADTAPSLLVYGAHVNIAGITGSRSEPLQTFVIGPGRTNLARAELVTSIDVTLPEPGSGSAFVRLTRRKGIDLAIVSAACMVTPDAVVRVACGAVAAVPFAIETRDRQTVVEQVVSLANPISDIRGSRDYRVAMLRVLVRRALETAERRCASR